MRDWLASTGGDNFAGAVFWTIVALAIVAAVMILFRIFRSGGAGTFISGGRSRIARLAVVDAAAIDNQRRLVLVRRDDVEHLLLIGGSNDIVIEPQIRVRQAGGLQPQEPRREAAPARVRQPVAQPPQPSSAPAVESPMRNEPGSERSSQAGRQQPMPLPSVDEVQERRPLTAAPARQPDVAHPEPPRNAPPPYELGREAEPRLPPASGADRLLATSGGHAPASGRQPTRAHDIAAASPAHERQSSIEEEMDRLLNELAEGRNKQE
ncbi:flagellar biosynthetic protein FliO [Chelativorans sp. Marseille-P2723]|uniref:flagellar biosynthetic protein FliO n=1 Tax=Chelativorans sp. Marseille-P2723 TaxID=2709133 RepID=UPI00156DCA2F|nr:flagellar biosynthetic protein FliO [Chelativorans sp. Marseille-P2723]